MHARPGALFVAEARRFDADITVSNGGEPVSASSSIGLAMLNARKGDTLHLSATGPDAGPAVAALAALIGSGFGE
nr:HPr family phosphocarrier protein [Tessaracoccus coleopterorum]